jgi:hypothetical protein
VWRDLTGGYNALWYMDGVNQVSTASLERLEDQNWKIRAVGDFDRDHKPDLFWQNKTTGQLAVWFHHDATRWGTEVLQDSELDLAWDVVGAADFNRDGYLDLFWRNTSTGSLRIWHMTGTYGTQRLDEQTLPYTVADQHWKIDAVGDMNGDDRPDLVWRYYGAAGTIFEWLMDDTTRLEAVSVSPALADLSWHIVGVADLNADGRRDLVWQNFGSGQIATWFMNGATQTGTSMLQPQQVTDLNWRIVGVR